MDSARGELVCFLDADDYWYPGRLDEALGILARDPAVDGVYDICEYVFANREARSVFGEREPARLGPGRTIDPDDLFRQVFDEYVPLWCTNGILVRRAALDRVGRMHPAFRLGQDIEFWFRMTMLLRLVGSPSRAPKAVYRRHAGNRWRPDGKREGFFERIRRESRFLLSWQAWMLERPVPPYPRRRVLRRLMHHLGWLGRLDTAWRVARAHGMPRYVLYALLCGVPDLGLTGCRLRRLKWRMDRRMREHLARKPA
jgi:glycosyltransferase involved in cell wall biosynthesis